MAGAERESPTGAAREQPELTGKAFEAPLLEMWRDLLETDAIGVDDSFFDVGGHSLLAGQMVARIQETWGREVPLRAVYENPTVAELALELARARRDEAGAIPPVSRDGPLPLSFAQQRLWFLDRLVPDSPLYNVPVAYRLSGPVDVRALEWAMGRLVQRHEGLRTRFATRSGRAVQVIDDAWAPSLAIEPIPGGEVAARQRAEEIAAAPFDLERGRLLRARLLRLSDQDHVLVLIVHHIVADGWSVGVLMRDLSAAYEARVQGRDWRPLALRVQYADFAAWQRSRLSGERLRRQLAYWKERLSGMERHELAADRARPVAGGHRGARLPFSLDRELVDRLTRVGREQGATLFMTLLAAFEVLLFRHTGQSDVVVGTPTAGRLGGDTDQLIGCFVNTLVLRTDLGGSPPFRQLLDRVRETALGAYAHQEVPFEQLVEELRPERDSQRNPLFQALFQLVNAREPELRLGAVTGRSMPITTGTSRLDLGFSLFLAEEGIKGWLDYAADLFDAWRMEALLGHFRTLLEAVVAGPDTPVSRLPLLGAQEARQVLRGWNRTPIEDPGVCVHELVERQVERDPAAVALVSESGTMSYGELNARANRLAHRLRRSGVGPEHVVGVCLERSPDLIVALLGVLKAGGAYLPLDPEYPADRLEYMLRDAAVTVLVTAGHVRPALRWPEESVILVDRDLAAGGTANPVAGVGPGNLCYVIYTSGSTGRPKGCLIGHAEAVSLIAPRIRMYDVSPRDCVVQSYSLAFDPSVWQFFGTLAAGARLLLPGPGPVSRTRGLAAACREHGVTLLEMTPGMLEWFLSESGEADLASVRMVLCGGEPLPMELVRRAVLMTGARMQNNYGPTEATIDATTYRVEPDERGPYAAIGRPVPNRQVYVLDANHEPVPVGSAGELYVGGRGLARGYVGMPGLTAERFVPDPFGELGGRLYRTGDVVRWRRDGNLEYLGRMDDQVKLRGHRVEPGEIEAVLRQQEGVRDAAVVMTAHDQATRRQLLAYVTLEAGAASELPGELRRRLRRWFPEYMVPAACVAIDELPLTPNGKLDRDRLPKPALATRDRGEGPREEVEERIAAIWADVLEVDRVGVHDDFFELGGHSLTVLEALSRVEECWSVQLAVSTIFEAPTVRELAAVVRAEKARATS